MRLFLNEEKKKEKGSDWGQKKSRGDSAAKKKGVNLCSRRKKEE